MTRINQNNKLNIREFTLSNIMVIFICLDIILIGIGLYLNFSGIYDMSRLWGLYPLILGIPGLVMYGFNIIYMLITAGGCCWLIFSNLSDNYPLAILLSCISVGIIGIFSYLISKFKK